MSQFNQTRILRASSTRSRITTAATVAAIGLSALLVACSPQDDQAGAGGSSVASDSADRKMRGTAGEAVERARQANGGATTSTDAAAGAAASGSTAAAQSAEETLRKTEAEVKAADEKLDKARVAAKQKITGKPAQ